MNENFPPFRLPGPQIADRKAEKRYVPLPAEVVARRHEIARLLGAKIESIAQDLKNLPDDQRKAIFFKLEHDGKIPLAGTGLKPIGSSDRVTLAVPKGDNL